MFGLPIGFASPWILIALVTLPIIWWLLRLTPPKPQIETFPPTRILAQLKGHDETPANSPWWLTLLRLLLAAIIIFAMAGPILNPKQSLLSAEGQTLLIMDDSWATAENWQNHQNTTIALVEEIRDVNGTIILQSTTGNKTWTGQPITPDEALEILNGTEPYPYTPDHASTAQRLDQILVSSQPDNVVFLSDGIEQSGTSELITSINRIEGSKRLFLPEDDVQYALASIRNEPRELTGRIIRSAVSGSPEQKHIILAKDENGLTIAQAEAVFSGTSLDVQFSIQEPLELRNQITRLDLEGVKHAAAVQLLDEGNRRRLIGLISGEAFDQSQPLLSPLYYISRALEPFADIRRADSANLAKSVPELVSQNVSAIVMADVGKLPEEAVDGLKAWIEKGGMLIRFGGPRLGGSQDHTLLPVELRPGDRNLGGALSWETPKSLAPFGEESPFFGLQPPKEVLINKQLLALQDVDLENKTWAVLEDGTPLVTAEQLEAGWIVFFHVGSDAEWSNLPLSGTFVEMLRRTVNLSRSENRQIAGEEEISLPPHKVLDATGIFVQAKNDIKPLVLKKGELKRVKQGNPPGLYGTEDGVEALNLIEGDEALKKIDATTLAPGMQVSSYLTNKSIPLSAWLFAAAAILLIADCLAVLWMSGTLKSFNLTKQAVRSSGWIFALVLIGISFPSQVRAQSNPIEIESVLKTRLAYVETGIDSIDRITRAGMDGLTQFLTARTALEPGEPKALDLAEDELSFYSLIYWPIDPEARLPSTRTMARVDAYMKKGGTILFDTRDQVSGALGGTSASPAARTLQQLLTTLDIPPLEPVPEDHVLTKSFYLLDVFPGRYAGGDLWVEVATTASQQEGRPARIGDGVSSIMITSNDFAGAWAVDASLSPLLPTIPADPAQRIYAFRTGVNLMMYVLTGNYKSDQVHLPALLERLGQ